MRNLIVPFLASLLALPMAAQAADDPPGRVARLSHIEGDVTMAPAGTQEWGEAVLNRPLTSEDRLWVDTGGRAELQVGSATIHLDSGTEFAFIELDDDDLTMNLNEGRATIRVVRKREQEVIEVNTPNASVSLLHPGEYHIEVDEDGEQTIVKARSGEAEVAGEKNSYTVRANEVGVFLGTDVLSSSISQLGSRTAFESWANERARRDERSVASRYVGEDVIGYEDLDEHGDWVSEPEYGYVWRPRHVVSGWAPYRDGRWAWVSPWGWTWIDQAPWGFAPFHYGRWAYVSQRWCWVPGPRHVRAVYAPALVAWTGGPHVSFGVSIGSGIGWFPLGPREVYVPGYWHTRRYIHRVNVSNTIIVNNTYITNAYRGRVRDFDYRYRGRSDAVTVVDREHFVRGRPVGGYARVDDRELRSWRNDPRPPAIAPDRDSILAGQPRTARTFDRGAATRRVVARRELPSRVNFDAERRAIEANGGRPIGRAQLIDRNPKDRGDVRIVRTAGTQIESRRATGSAPRIGAPGQTAPVQTANGQTAPVQRAPVQTANGQTAPGQTFETRATPERATRERISGERDRALDARERSQPQRAVAAGQALESMPAEERSHVQRTQRSLMRESRSPGEASSALRTRETPQGLSRAERNASSHRLEQPRAFQPRQDQSPTIERQRQQLQRAGEAQRMQREAGARERSAIIERRSEPAPRSYSAPQQRAESRMERSAPVQRASPERSNSNPKAGSSSVRGERGGNRER